MSQLAVKPFDFAKLPKFSSRALSIGQGLLQRYPQLSQGDALRNALLEPLEKELSVSTQLVYQGMEELTLSEFLSNLASPCLAVLLRSTAPGQKIILEIDYDLGCGLVGMVMGEGGRQPSHIRSLSPIEEGVLEYLLVKSLSQVKPGTGTFGPVAFKVARIVNDARMLLDCGPSDEAGCLFQFHLSLGEVNGAIRAFLPHPLVEGCFLRDDVVSGPMPPGDDETLERRLERVSHIKTTLWSEIGRVTLSALEKSQLEKGDVILFDETLASKGPQGITGKALLRVGEIPTEGLLAEIIDTEGRMTLKVLDFYGGE